MYKLTDEGKEYLKNGLPEKQLLKAIGEGKPMAEVVKMPKSQIAIGWARKNGWVKIENNIVTLTDEGKKAEKERTPSETALEEVDRKGEANQDALKILINRNLAEEAKEVKKAAAKVSLWHKIKRMFSKKKQAVAKTDERGVAADAGTPQERRLEGQAVQEVRDRRTGAERVSR